MQPNVLQQSLSSLRRSGNVRQPLPALYFKQLHIRNIEQLESLLIRLEPGEAIVSSVHATERHELLHQYCKLN
jgi:hypothetical protein